MPEVLISPQKKFEIMFLQSTSNDSTGTHLGEIPDPMHSALETGFVVDFENPMFIQSIQSIRCEKKGHICLGNPTRKDARELCMISATLGGKFVWLNFASEYSYKRYPEVKFTYI